MSALITLRQANDHLRLDLPMPDDPADDPVLEDDFAEIDDPRVADVRLKMAQAEAIIFNYLKVDSDDVFASPSIWTDAERSCAQSAVLLVLSALYDDAKDKTLGDYMMPGGVVALLLMRMRDPALA